METIVNYSLQSGLCLLLLYLFYVLLLRNQPSLRYNRLYLLLAPAVALATPLFRIPLPFADGLSVAAAIPSFQLQEVTVVGSYGPEKEATDSLSLGVFLLGLYTLVGLALLGKLAWQLVQVHRLARIAIPLKEDGTEATVLQTEAHYPTFAFLHYVFLSHQPHLSEKEQNQVLAHELAHVRLRHTYDILYYEVLTALLWFNPLVWLLKEELRDVHEYQADAEVLADYQPQEYSSLLAKEVLYTTGIPVGSYFQKPQVFRRLNMLQQHGRKSSMFRSVLVLPLLFVLLLTFSVDQVIAEMPASLQESQNQDVASIPAIVMENEETSPVSGITHSPTTPANTAVSVPDSEKKPVFSEVENAPGLSEKEKPYTYVNEMPMFNGGEAEMLKFLGQNIRYPKALQESGLEGLVVLTFVVETDGSLIDIVVVKSLHVDADKEAVRVVDAMSGHWTPGKQNGKVVPVRYTIPIRFAMK
ncbi:MAG: M56 family metallopeptidase [Hymenobacteraceae bacterium]|nr:M56 family metallopeptidase [Hymenobacteraceae bacterium]